MTDEFESAAPGWQETENNAHVDEPVPEESLAPTHFEPPHSAMGLDGSTPFDAGIQGRLTHAGGVAETPRNDRDWQVHVDVDQPVQQVGD